MKERREPTVSKVLNSPDEPSDSRRTRTPLTQESKTSPTRNSVPEKTIIKKSSSGFLWFTFFITIIAFGGAGYGLWQLEQAKIALNSQKLRIVQLEAKLAVSDNSASQSLGSLGAKLQELSSNNKMNTLEIDKLWGTRNVNRNAIMTNKKTVISIEAKQKKLTPLNTTVATLGNTIKGLNKKVAELTPLTSTLASTSQTVTEHDLLLQSVRERVSIQNKSLKSAHKQIDNLQESITSLNAFRRTVNRDLLQLKQANITSQ